jgi:hypothetical protein
MKAILFVSGDEQSRKLLIMLKNRYDLGDKLKKVKINMKLKEPYMSIGGKKKKGYNEILTYLMAKPQNKGHTPIPKPMDYSYEDHAYSCLYSDSVKSQIDDEEVDDEIKSKKKVQYEQQYERQLGRVENPSHPPKRVPVEPPMYKESIEEQKEDELMDFYNKIMKSGGN